MLGTIGRPRASSVSGRDGADDREPEAGAAAASCGVGAGESVEGMCEELRREAGSFVCHVQLYLSVVARGGEVDGAVSVAERVVDEVRECLLESDPVPGIRNLHPSYRSLLVKFDVQALSHDELEEVLRVLRR